MKTIYIAQTFKKAGRRLVEDQRREFPREDDARRWAESRMGSMLGVSVVKVEGEPEFDYWDEPVVVFSHGDTPELP